MTENDKTARNRRGRPRRFAPDEAVERAMAAFWAGGYEATGMAALLSDMGIGRQSAYNAFGGKRDLFLAALDHYGATRMAGLVDVLQDPEAGVEAVKVVLTRWGTAGAISPGAGCMLVNTLAEFGGSDPDVAERAVAQIQQVREQIHHALERAQKSGEIRAGPDLDDAALLLVAVAIGLNLIGRLGIPPAQLTGAIETLSVIWPWSRR